MLATTALAEPATGPQLTTVESRYFDTAGAIQPLGQPADRLYFEFSEISFSSSWELRNRTGIDPRYRDRIRDSYGPMMVEELNKAYEEAGFEIVDEPDQADLLGTASMTELFINAPETNTISTSYVRRAGHVTLDLSFSSPGRDAAVIQLTTHKDTREHDHGLQLSPRNRNYQDFRELVRRWASEAAELTSSLSR